MSNEQKRFLSQPESSINQLSARTPSGPDFVQSTIQYSNQALTVSLNRFSEVLHRQFPHEVRNIDNYISQIKNSNPTLPESDFIINQGKKAIRKPDGGIRPLNTIGFAVFEVNPRLGIYEYLEPLYAPTGKTDNKGRFPWFNNRLNAFAAAGNLPNEDPKVALIATAYLTQVGKSRATERSSSLLKRAEAFGGIDSSSNLSPYMERLGKVFDQIKTDQQFIRLGLRTMNNINKANNFSPEYTSVLLDISFIRNKAFDHPSEFKLVLEPLFRLITSNNWDEAIAHRDFLLKYFCSSFPAWRGKEYRESGESTFESFKDLAQAIVNRRLTLDEGDIPTSYKSFLTGAISEKVEKAQKVKDRSILKSSVNISNQVLIELETKRKDVLQKQALQNAIEIDCDNQTSQILLDPQVSLNEKQDAFFDFMEANHPNLTQPIIMSRFVSLQESLRKLFYEVKPPYNLETPRKTKAIGIELLDNKQICWIQKDNPRKIKTNSGLITTTKRPVNFGKMLYDLITASSGESEPTILSVEDIAEAINKAFESEEKSSSRTLQFTKGEYIKALLNSEKSLKNFTSENPDLANLD